MRVTCKRNWRVCFTADDLADYCDDFPGGWKLVTAYLYDPGEHTHLCEFTPSHWLICVGQSVESDSAESWEAWRDEESREQEHLLESWEEVQPGSDTYMHVSSVERLPSIDSGVAVEYDDDGAKNVEDAEDWAYSNCAAGFYASAETPVTESIPN